MPSVIKVDTEEQSFAVGFKDATLTEVVVNDTPLSIKIKRTGPSGFIIEKDGKTFVADVLKADIRGKSFTIKVNGRKYALKAQDQFDQLLHQMGMSGMNVRKVNELRSPMPGLVQDIPVAEGTTVKVGDPLIVLEAMKMENVLKSPTDGVVKKVVATQGKAVEKNEVLILFE